MKSSSESPCRLIQNCQNERPVEIISRTPSAGGDLHVKLGGNSSKSLLGLTATSQVRGARRRGSRPHVRAAQECDEYFQNHCRRINMWTLSSQATTSTPFLTYPGVPAGAPMKAPRDAKPLTACRQPSASTLPEAPDDQRGGRWRTLQILHSRSSSFAV